MSLGFGVYEIIDRQTGKSYIGQSKNPTGRWQFHVQDAFAAGKQFPLSQDMRTLGLPAFDFRLLESCPDEATAKDREKWHIAQRINAGQPLYNILLTERLGYGAFGDDNPYVSCFCRFGHVCRPKPALRRTPSARAHKVSPEVFDVIQRLRKLDVHMKKIAQALDLSVGIVHRYCGQERPRKLTGTSDKRASAILTPVKCSYGALSPECPQNILQKKMGIITKVGDPELF
jgi:hypothetical protein